MMRTSRIRMRGKGCYYHCMNRLAGKPGEYPIDDLDKERAWKILLEVCAYYQIEVVSACWMGNHHHIVFYLDPTPPSLEETAARHNAYYGKRRLPLDPKNTERCAEIAKQMVDFSHFMRLYQQKFGIYFNKRHGRRGALWADRFKSVILGGVNALWNECVSVV